MSKLRITNDQGSPFTNGRAEIDGLPAVLCDLRIEVEEIEMPTGGRYVPDPNWIFVDAKEHFHATSVEAASPHPTLIRQSKGDGFDDEDEETFVHWFECRICGEHIEPGTMLIDGDNWRRTEPGPMTWYADIMINPFTEENYGGGDLVSFRAKIYAKSEVFGIATVNRRSGNAIELIGVGPIGRRNLT
jgi:hypothetical protein